MPDPKKYNLTYRPNAYWGITAENTHIGATVKGELRRQAAKDMAAVGHLDSLISVESLPYDNLAAVGSVHPWFMGGEYLPDLKPCEVEIARVVLKTTTLDVISIRARKTKNRIHYRIANEYRNDPDFDYIIIQKTSLRPLTMKRLIELIDNARDNGGLSGSARYWNSQNRDDYEELYDFATISSEFYPELESWYDDANLEWLDTQLCERKYKRSLYRK